MKLAPMLAITIALTMLAACKPGTLGTTRTPDYHTGTSGLEASFLPNAPPQTVFEKEALPVIVELANRGATDIANGAYALAIEETIIDARDERIGSIDITGKNDQNPTGGKTRLAFDLTPRPLDPQTETYTTTLSFTACYPYQTAASATVCIDPDLFDERANKPCKPSTQTLAGGQGAPIAITRIEPAMLSHTDKNRITPEFTIQLANTQKGIVVAPGQTERACSSQAMEPNSIGVVTINAALADQQLTCQPRADEKSKAATIKLGATNVIRCTLKEGIPKARGTYSTILSVTVDYGYTTTISKQVRIQKRP